ncbi:hypothetical protein DMX02_25235 [Pseudomonas jessenii]|nr:hypothetical protein DMX02_25235 [Pseudomonas jessenii]
MKRIPMWERACSRKGHSTREISPLKRINQRHSNFNRNYFHPALSLSASHPAHRQLRNISIQEPPYVPFARHFVAPQSAGRRHRAQRAADQQSVARR